MRRPEVLGQRRTRAAADGGAQALVEGRGHTKRLGDGASRLAGHGSSPPGGARPVIGDRRRRSGRRSIRPAPGHLRGLHRIRPQPLVHRGLPARRRAPPLREHAHRVVRHRAADDQIPRGCARGWCWKASAATTAPTRSSSAGRARPRRSTGWWMCWACACPPSSTSAGGCARNIPARRAPGRVHRAVRAPQQRAPVAGVHRRRCQDPRGPGRAHRPRAAARGARALRGPAAQDRVVLGRIQCHRHRERHHRDLAAAARARRAVVLRLRRVGALRRRSRWTRPATPSPTKTPIFISPHKFIGGPGTPGVLVARRELFQNSVPGMPGGGTVQYVNALEHIYATDIEHREEGGTPGHRRVDPRRAGLPAEGGRRRGCDPRARARLHPAGDGAVVGESRSSRCWAARRPSGSRSSRSRSGTTAGTFTTTSWSRCSTTCSASSHAAAARAPARTGTGCSGSTSRPRTPTSARSSAVARGSNPAGCG